MGIPGGSIGGFMGKFYLLALALMHSASVWADSPIVVQAPCVASGSSYLRSCSDVLVKGQIPMIRQKVLEYVDGSSKNPGLYQNVDTDPAHPPGSFFGPTVCSLVPNQFTNSIPEDKGFDHHGKSCGLPLDIRFSIDIPMLGSCAVGKPTITPTITQSKDFGQLELGYLRGAYVDALACYSEEVLTEVQSARQITVKDMGPGIPSKCLALAKDVSANNAQSQAILSKLTSELQSSANIADIVNCERKTGDLSSVVGPGVDVGSLRQSAQQLCAARINMEAEFASLVACEIFGRASSAYELYVQSPTAHTALLNQIANPDPNNKSNVAYACAAQCQKQLDHGSCNVPSSQQITDCAKNCYNDPKNGFPAKFREFIQQLFPAPGSGQACKQLSFLPIGFLIGSVRRKRTGTRSAKRRSLLLLLLLLLIAIAAGAGCSSSPSGLSPTQLDTCNAGDSLPANTCCIDQKKITVTPPITCPVTPPGDKQNQQAVQTGADSVAGASTALKAAGDLIGLDKVAVQAGGAPFAQTSAAGEGATTVTKADPKDISASLAPGPQGTGGGRNLAGGNGSGAGSAGGGSAGLDGAATTAPSDPSLLSQLAAMLGGDGAKGAY
ncbi:MAG: hypothetical protein ACXWOH_08335, partial [Bdellovibrionota bacterium]